MDSRNRLIQALQAPISNSGQTVLVQPTAISSPTPSYGQTGSGVRPTDNYQFTTSAVRQSQPIKEQIQMKGSSFTYAEQTLNIINRPIGQLTNQMSNEVSSSRYNNKYSFKRNSNTNYKSEYISDKPAQKIRNINSEIQTNLRNQNNQLRAQLAQRDSQLNRIREFALQRKTRSQGFPPSAEGVQCINSAIQIYNTSIAHQRDRYQELAFLSFVPNKISILQQPPSNLIVAPAQQNQIIKPITPLQSISPPKPQPPTNIIITPSPKVRPTNSNSQLQMNYIPNQSQYIPNSTFDYNTFILPSPASPLKNTTQIDNKNSLIDGYIRQIRQLRSKIDVLQSQKADLIDKIRNHERNNFTSPSSQQTIDGYRHEIQNLKIQITELNQLYRSSNQKTDFSKQMIELNKTITILTESNKNYEAQLQQAQQHIIYLQNNKQQNNNNNTSSYESQISNLRETIARYTEHIEQIDKEKQEYERLLTQREEENNNYVAELNKLHLQIEQQEEEKAKSKYTSSQTTNINQTTVIDNKQNKEYEQLAALYSHRQLQRLILLEEINRLNHVQEECHEHLERAEEYIIQLQSTIDEGLQPNAILTDSVLQVDTGVIQEWKQQVNILTVKNQQLIRQRDTVILAKEETIKERDLITQKLSQANAKIASVTASPIREPNNQQIVQLQNMIAQLNLQLQDTENHLKSAQTYIEENMKAWNQKQEYQVNSADKIAFLEHLTKDFQLLKAQNIELSTKLNSFDNIVRQMQTLKAQNQKLSISIQSQSSHTSTSNNTVQITEQLSTYKSSVSKLTQQIQTYQSTVNTLTRLTQQLQVTKKELITNQIRLNTVSKELQTTQKEGQRLILALKESENKTIVKDNDQGSQQVIADLLIQIQSLKLQNQQLTLTIKDYDIAIKHDAEVSQEFIVKLSQANEQISRLKTEYTKIAQLEEYLKRAQNIIIEQEQKMNVTIKTYEADSKDMKSHLQGAQTYIKDLEERMAKLQAEKVQINKRSDQIVQENNIVHLALKTAQKQIFILEQQYVHKKK